ncbi:MAG: putative membrane protein [Candidatus Micrarchaeota archaeon]|nr:MAG: putative membrane protein [Candidatus Micrarchaeota archaeon]
MYNYFTSEEFIEASTLLISLLSLALAIVITVRYIKFRSKSLFFWSLGLWAFTASAFEEVIFALGLYSELLIDIYLFLVAMVVELLAMGSINLIRSNRSIRLYYIYSIIADMLLFYSLYISKVGNIIENYIVYGSLPLSVVITSSIITFPAAVIIAAIAALSYKRDHNKKLLSIIAGVIVVSIAGTLYIAQFPAFLYYAEFIGILLLWIGFI